MRKHLLILVALIGLELLATFLNRRWPAPWLVTLEGLLVPGLLFLGGRPWIALGALALTNLLLPASLPPAQIHINKSEHSLRLQDLQLSIGLGPSQGPKQREGDGKTPEGDYYVCSKESTENDRWMGLSYPNLKDGWRGKAQGLITWSEFSIIALQTRLHKVPWQSTRLGGGIGIHNGGQTTAGCIGLRLPQLEQVYPQVQIGTPVHINP